LRGQTEISPREIKRNSGLITVGLTYELLFGRASQVAATLAAAGFQVKHGVEKHLVAYILASSRVPKLICATRVGWVFSEDGALGFNLRDRSLGDVDGFDFSRLLESKNLLAMQESGDVEAWKSNVAMLAKGHPLLRFLLCLALTGPLLRLLGAESFGVHLCDVTSTGKTTGSLLACSVWGAANRPGSGPTLLFSFNSTTNALESLCESRNDMLMVFDEIGSHDGGSFTVTIYRIAGGVQKGRLGRDGNLRECSEWQFTFITTGERSVLETLAEDTREGRVRSGQTVRLLNLDTDNRIIRAKNQSEATEIVSTIRSAIIENYGSAGPEFVQRLIEAMRDDHIDRDTLRETWDDCLDDLMVPNLENHHVRALRHLALVALAGLLAVDLDILPFTDAEILESVHVARDMYLASPDMLGDAAREAQNVKDYIEENRDRFRRYTKGSEPVRGGQVGYQYTLHGEVFYLFTKLGLGRAAKARNLKGVLKFLLDRNLLHVNNPGKFQAKVPFIDFAQSRFEYERVASNVDGKRRQVGFYAVSEELLKWDHTNREVSSRSDTVG
jgi:putative DNA primase/helicase